MCRLFGLSAAPDRVRATFWLLEAPDSLARQSHREPDGVGLGTFTARDAPLVEKQPIAAYEDRLFAREARERESRTFVAHVRFASTGGLTTRNTIRSSSAGGCSPTTACWADSTNSRPNSASIADSSTATPIPNVSSPSSPRASTATAVM
ncbi:glutamine amidotransferase [Nocardia seriolae]|uniref:Glutamine amidotransferase n=1 Tax=Nocardia seriolae TaxID=37332 RepID=A0ABC9Z489_9NOCA|nr:hypothetical protein NSERKGN1266_42600 [Nocardia seriolae]BEK95759.1 hypothetical protein NSER024013_36650 [Nocardia seriolae]GAM49602.1 glutamine amidotransferase [Nocardia seriolae]GAP32371.1 glutamine amidotransferase [Nocardia seriolae]